MDLKEYEKSFRLRFANGISVEILKRGKAFGGLGQVKWRRRKLRSAERPVMPLIRTPDGYEVSRLRLHDIRKGRESVTLELMPFVRRSGRMEWVSLDGQDRWNVGAWEQKAVRDRGGLVRVVLRAVRRTIGGLEFAGFSYSYRLRSRKYRAYRIHDRSTWELGGRATGNSFWMGGPVAEPQKFFHSKRDSYSSAWRGDGGRCVPVQQFLPFFTLLDGFTFQFDRQSVLLTTFDAPFHCLSLFQKDAGQNCIVHWHQLCCDLGGRLEFPAHEVLVADCPEQAPTDRADQYCLVRQELQRACCERLGVVREPAAMGGRLAAGPASSQQALRKGMDELSRAGCARIYVPGLFRHLGPAAGPAATPRASEEAGRHVRQVVERAHQRGAEVAASLLDCSAPWVVASASADVEEDGAAAASGAAGGSELVARAMRNGSDGRLLRDHLRRLRKAVGVDVLFADGMLEQITDLLEWGRPQADGAGEGEAGIRSLFDARQGLIADLQRMGYGCLLAGAAGLGAPLTGPRLAMLKGREYMFRDRVLEFPRDALAVPAADAVEVYFRAAANRLAYVLTYDARHSASSRLPAWWHPDMGAVNHAYQAVREHMERSQLLSEDRGVLWTGADPDVRVLWCYRPFAWHVGERAEAFDVIASQCVEPQEGEFSPRALSVYLVQNAEGP